MPDQMSDHGYGFFHYWPQILILFLMLFNIVFTMAHDGEDREGKWSGPGLFISNSVQWWVLWMGGFFEEFNWPQMVMAVLIALGYFSAFFVHGEYRTGKWNTKGSLISNLVVAWILWMGYFW